MVQRSPGDTRKALQTTTQTIRKPHQDLKDPPANDSLLNPNLHWNFLRVKDIFISSPL